MADDRFLSRLRDARSGLREVRLTALILALSSAAHAAEVASPLTAQVDHVVDGDTLVVRVPAWAGTPVEVVSVRISGIDAPEREKPPGKCRAEVVLGKAAAVFAKTLTKPGDTVTLTYRGHDKYFRIDADVGLPDGRDWATVLLSSGNARAWSGAGAKPNWCAKK